MTTFSFYECFCYLTISAVQNWESLILNSFKVFFLTDILARKAHRIFNSKFIDKIGFYQLISNYHYHYYYFNIQLFLLTPSCLDSLVVGLAALSLVSVQLTFLTSLLGVVKPGAANGILHLFWKMYCQKWEKFTLHFWRQSLDFLIFLNLAIRVAVS